MLLFIVPSIIIILLAYFVLKNYDLHIISIAVTLLFAIFSGVLGHRLQLIKNSEHKYRQMVKNSTDML
jgi:C4-dicarboxylate transporter